MNVRAAAPDDAELLFDIRTSVRENHQSRAELASIGVTPRSVAEMLRTTSRAWVAEAGGGAVGFSMADAAEGTVFAMFVRPGWEGRGAGRALMREAEAWLFTQGWEEIWLLTGRDPALRANGFYRRLGWTEAEWRADGQVKYVKSKPAR
jgi:GNAT superfamily N-acetyltransferase